MAILSACCCILSFRAVWNSHCILTQYCTLAPSRIAHHTYCTGTYCVYRYGAYCTYCIDLYSTYQYGTRTVLVPYVLYVRYCSQQHLCTVLFAFSVPCTARFSLSLSTICARFRAESPFSLASHSQSILNLR